MDNVTIGNKITNLRKEKGISQETLAEEVGVSRQTVSSWENGTKIPQAQSIKALSEYFNVSADFLMKDGVEIPDIADTAQAEIAVSTQKRKLSSKTITIIVISTILIILAIIMSVILIGLFTYKEEGVCTVSSVTFNFTQETAIVLAVIGIAILIAVCALIITKLVKRDRKDK